MLKQLGFLPRLRNRWSCLTGVTFRNSCGRRRLTSIWLELLNPFKILPEQRIMFGTVYLDLLKKNHERIVPS